MENKTYHIDGSESACSIIWAQAITPHGTVRWIGDAKGRLYAPSGEIIGSFYKVNHGYSVWTQNYAGFAYPEEVEIRK